MKPLLAIKCLVYNHEPYLRQCLDGFVMQQTDFPFVAIVHDDCSTDKSADIICEYEAKYPDIIKPIYEKENQHSKHDGSLDKIINDALAATCCEYFAWCEGDDYWTDPLKLQKQVDFLEANPDFAICFHAVKVWNEQEGKLVDDTITKEVDSVTTIEDLAEGNFIHTPSVVYRYKEQVSAEFRGLGPLPAGDYPQHMLYAQYGKIKKMPDFMGVYRLGCGMWSKLEESVVLRRWITVLVALMKHFAKDDAVYRILCEQLKADIERLVIAEKEQTDNGVRSTKAYRLGRFILHPFSWLKRKLK